MTERNMETSVLETRTDVEPYLPEAANALASIFQVHENIRLHLENGTLVGERNTTGDLLKALVSKDETKIQEARRLLDQETSDSRLSKIRKVETYDGLKKAMVDVFKNDKTVSHVLETATEDFDKAFESVYRGGRHDSSIIEEDEDGVLAEQLDAIKIETKSLISRLKEDFSPANK